MAGVQIRASSLHAYLQALAPVIGIGTVIVYTLPLSKFIPLFVISYILPLAAVKKISKLLVPVELPGSINMYAEAAVEVMDMFVVRIILRVPVECSVTVYGTPTPGFG